MKPLRAACLSFLGLAAASAAHGELTISPLRQVLDAETQAVEYRISNPSRRIVEGRVRWIDLLATETGYLPASADDRAKMSAAPYLTVTPAQFRLEPGASAAIVVARREGAVPPPGERRSHLVIESAAARTPIRKAGGSLELDIGLGVSTPVILRTGAGVAAARIGAARLLRTAEGSLDLETVIHPKGDFSAYGRIDVVLRAPAPGEGETLLASLGNVAAYTDAPQRRLTLPLGVERLPPGILEIRFIGEAEFEGELFASRSFEVAPPRDAPH